jgi:ribosome biogenesis GTPase A
MNQVKFRTEFVKGVPNRINWFPGHMRRAMRLLEDEIKKVNVFIEVRDARIPKTSRNPELIALLPEKMKRLVVYNKIDLACERKAVELIKDIHLNEKDAKGKEIPYMHLSTKKNVNMQKLLSFIQTNACPEFKTVGSWIMIGGMPNVGKSTIINSLRSKDADLNHSKKAGARTGGVPCITKSISGFRIMTDPATYITDTPGIIVPKIENVIDGMKMCACNIIRDGIVEDSSVCDFILYTLNQQRNFAYVKRYDLPNKMPSDSINEVLNAC